MPGITLDQLHSPPLTRREQSAVDKFWASVKGWSWDEHDIVSVAHVDDTLPRGAK